MGGVSAFQQVFGNTLLQKEERPDTQNEPMFHILPQDSAYGSADKILASPKVHLAGMCGPTEF